MPRDYQAEMKAKIEELTPTEGYVSALLAQTIVTHLRKHDPELLAGWLNDRAVQILREEINRRDRGRRAHLRRIVGRSVFHDAVLAHESGDSGPLEAISRGNWLESTIVIEDNIRKPLAKLTANDLKYAADSYYDRGNKELMIGQFLLQLKRRLAPGEVVEDRFDNETLDRVWRSLSRRP